MEQFLFENPVCDIFEDLSFAGTVEMVSNDLYVLKDYRKYVKAIGLMKDPIKPKIFTTVTALREYFTEHFSANTYIKSGYTDHIFVIN